MKKNFQRNKNISKIFTILALVLSHLMCIVVAYNYRDMLCGIAHSGYSAPAEMAFLTAIPYAAGIMICGFLVYIFHKEEK